MWFYLSDYGDVEMKMYAAFNVEIWDEWVKPNIYGKIREKKIGCGKLSQHEARWIKV